MKVKALKFTKNHGFHGNSRKWAFFTEEGPSRIRLVNGMCYPNVLFIA